MILFLFPWLLETDALLRKILRCKAEYEDSALKYTRVDFVKTGSNS
jgi:hypothetical protein